MVFTLKMRGLCLDPYPALRQLIQPANPGSERIWTVICKTKSDVVGATTFLPFTNVSYLFPKEITAERTDSAEESVVREVQEAPVSLNSPHVFHVPRSLTEEEWLMLIENDLAEVPSTPTASVPTPQVLLSQRRLSADNKISSIGSNGDTSS
jgi:hypothetical protein